MTSFARIDELRQKFDENPRRYFAPLANEYRKAGELAQAIEICRTHLAQQPGHMSGHIVLAQALYEAGQADEAREVFHQALELDPENLIALRHLGDIARDRGDLAEARDWYQRVLDADPRNPDIGQRLEQLDAMAAEAGSPVAAPEAAIEPTASEPPAEAPTPEPEPSAAPEATAFEPMGFEAMSFESASLEPTDWEPTAPAADAQAGDEREAESAASDAGAFDAFDFGAPDGSALESLAAPFGQEPGTDAQDMMIGDDAFADVFGQQPPEAESPEATADFGEVTLESYLVSETAETASIEGEVDAMDLGALELTADAPEIGGGEAETGDAFGDSLLSESPFGAFEEPAAPAEEATPAAMESAAADVEEQVVAEHVEATAPEAGAVAASAEPEEPAGEEVPAPPAAPGDEAALDDVDLLFAAEETSAAETVSEARETPARGVETTAETAFVTETMAELYLRQGFREQALDVYRQLVQQQPEDEGLRARMAALEAELSAAAPAPAARVTGRYRAVMEQSPDAPRVGDWLRQLAQGRVVEQPRVLPWEYPPEPEPAEPAAASAPEQPSSVAAEAPSLDRLFGAPQEEERPAAGGSSTPTPSRGQSFSFEQFFQQADTSAAPQPPAEERRGTEESEAAAELADFHAWLSGLKKQ